MADSWEDEDFDLPTTAPPTTVPVSWEDEVKRVSSICLFVALSAIGVLYRNVVFWHCH